MAPFSYTDFEKDDMEKSYMEFTKSQQKPLAMAYVPWQYFTRAYEPQAALKKGTIFPELDKPFTGKKGDAK